MALTVMLVVGAGFGAAAVPPDWRSGGDGARSAAASRSTPADPDLEAADDPVFRRGSPQRPLGAVDDPLTLLVLLLSLAGLAFALSRNERLVSADDHRPDAGSELDRVGGLATAPQVEDLKPAAAVALVDEALGLLRADLEPRLAVRCAYAAVASGLGRAELARRPSETEGEFLERHLARFDRTAAEPLERLTTTFERAR
ncbi:MAG: DUF4129 domain-containing protein, partial [Acidimicrobiia bacterium]|nr:DUF4129 domain-containing protein [Acidimicrobiia bacterium]